MNDRTHAGPADAGYPPPPSSGPYAGRRPRSLIPGSPGALPAPADAEIVASFAQRGRHHRAITDAALADLGHWGEAESPLRVATEASAGSASTTPAANLGGTILAPTTIDFGTTEVGDCVREQRTLWNRGAAELYVTRAALAPPGDSAFQLEEAPTRLLPSDAPTAERAGRMTLAFQPRRRHLHTGRLELHLAQALMVPAHELISIALVGGVRDVEPPASCVGAAARDEKEVADARPSRGRSPAPRRRSDRFDAQRAELWATIDAIDAGRIEAVHAVEIEALRYQPPHRAAQPDEWDYLLEGAILALTLGSAGIAAGFSPTVQAETRGAARGLQRMIARAIGAGLAQAASQLRTRWTKTVAVDDVHAQLDKPISFDPVAGFFATQRIAIVESSLSRKRAAARELEADAAPTVDDTLDAADVSRAIDAALGALGAIARGATIITQAEHTRSQWLSTVSKRAGDTQAAKPGCAELDLWDGPRRVSRLRAGQARPGVVDLFFSADLRDPEEPVRLVAAKVTGVSRHLARSLPNMDLIATRVPLRAIAQGLTYGGQRLAVPRLSIARNEEGTIDVLAGDPTEATATNQEAHYLAAKAAPRTAHRRRPEDIQAGARRVVEQEIATGWSGAVEVKTDDAGTAEP